jgi:hypothetical protein
MEQTTMAPWRAGPGAERRERQRTTDHRSAGAIQVSGDGRQLALAHRITSGGILALGQNAIRLYDLDQQHDNATFSGSINRGTTRIHSSEAISIWFLAASRRSFSGSRGAKPAHSWTLCKG